MAEVWLQITVCLPTIHGVPAIILTISIRNEHIVIFSLSNRLELEHAGIPRAGLMAEWIVFTFTIDDERTFPTTSHSTTGVSASSSSSLNYRTTSSPLLDEVKFQ